MVITATDAFLLLPLLLLLLLELQPLAPYPSLLSPVLSSFAVSTKKASIQGPRSCRSLTQSTRGSPSGEGSQSVDSEGAVLWSETE